MKKEKGVRKKRAPKVRWTIELDALLMKRVGEGCSRTAIVEEIERIVKQPVSYHAVIGQISRVKHNPQKRRALEEEEKKKREWTSPPYSLPPPMRHSPLSTVEQEKLVALEKERRDRLRKIMNAREKRGHEFPRNRCQWQTCGNTAQPGRKYCAEHLTEVIRMNKADQKELDKRRNEGA